MLFLFLKVLVCLCSYLHLCIIVVCAILADMKCVVIFCFFFFVIGKTVKDLVLCTAIFHPLHMCLHAQMYLCVSTRFRVSEY